MMRRTLAVLCLALAGTQPAWAAEPAVTSVPQFDIVNYMGQWYEIAKYPNRSQVNCRRNSTANYKMLEDGGIEVVNRCEKEDGKVEEAVGRVRQGNAPGRLNVRFAPSWLSFVPWISAPYWVIQLAPDYRYAVVGEPDRDYLWILARSPTLSQDDLHDIRAKLTDQGYDTEKLQRTEQTSTTQPK